jgi:hypothetical protein
MSSFFGQVFLHLFWCEELLVFDDVQVAAAADDADFVDDALAFLEWPGLTGWSQPETEQHIEWIKLFFFFWF